jgi:hypothetical protein
MSVLKVDTIQTAAGTGSLTVPAETGTVVTTASTSLGRRNLIINGAMQVAQRGTQVTGETGSGYKTCDRWQAAISSLGTWTIDQSTDAPSGFSNSFKLTCTTADASPAAGDAMYLRYSIEAQDCQHLAYGSSSANTTTLSFWVKSNKTGTYKVAPYVSDSGRLLGGTYTINSADTWEQKTITIIGDTGGSIANDNGDGLVLHFFLGAGSNFTSGTSQSAWTAYSAGDFGAGQTVNLADATSNYFEITGVQLEVGSVATPFEHRSYGEELALCQRYFWRYTQRATYSPDGIFPFGSAYSTTSIQTGGVTFPVTMRSHPTLSFSGTIVFSEGSSNRDSTLTSFAGTAANVSSCAFWIGGFTGLTQYRGYFGYMKNAGDWFAADAEL